MPTLTEAFHPGEFIISEAAAQFCRDNLVIAENQALVVGQVLGRRVAAGQTVTSSAAADAANTGNGTLTLDGAAPVAQGAKDGAYRVVALTAGASAEFAVYDPTDAEVGRVATGATYNADIKFALAAGGTNFAVGDAFTVTVGIQDANYEYAALNLSATDGTETVAAIAVYPITTTSAQGKIAGMRRGPAQVRGSDLTWPSGATAAQIAEGVRQLERLGIVAR
jgi:hypothetical protein